MTKHLNTKNFQETLNAEMCGPASLKIILHYYGIDKTEAELAELVGFKPGLGTDAEGISRAGKALGFNVEIKNESDFSDIESWLEKDVPVIVDWFTRGRQDYPDSTVSDGHYSVVSGIDDQYIYLQDPEIGAIRRIEKDDFKKVWFDFSGEYIKPEDLIIRQIIAIYK